MTFSNLISGTLPHHGKYSSRGGVVISRVIPHHWAGTSGGDTRLTNPNEACSANYIIYSNGSIYGQVPEEYRAWTTGSASADNPSITIEIQNSTGAPDWKISDEALGSLCRLIADISVRYGFNGVSASQVRGHYEFYATACPGPYVKSKHSYIVATSDAYARGTIHPSLPIPTDRTVSELADAVLAGDYGNGDDRRRNLGDRYDEVQAEVNRRLLGAPTTKTVSELADEVIAGVHGNGNDRVVSLGARYNEVQAEVNRKLGAVQQVQPDAQVDISRLADAVIRGDYGNGEDRRQALGGNYDAVQAEVNRRYGM